MKAISNGCWPPPHKNSSHLLCLGLSHCGNMGQWFVSGNRMMFINPILQYLCVTTRPTNTQGLLNYISLSKPVAISGLFEVARRRGLLHTGLPCANQRNFLNSVFFCDLHKTSPEKEHVYRIFLFLSVIQKPVRTFGYA